MCAVLLRGWRQRGHNATRPNALYVLASLYNENSSYAIHGIRVVKNLVLKLSRGVIESAHENSVAGLIREKCGTASIREDTQNGRVGAARVGRNGEVFE